MMHICTVATLCFPDKTVPRNYYYCVQDDNSLSLCFKSMYRILFVAIFTSAFIFSMFKSSHTYRNINISNQLAVLSRPFGLVLCCFTSRDSLASSLSSSDLISSCTNWMMEYTRRRRSDILPICKRNILNVCSHLLLYHRRIWH